MDAWPVRVQLLDEESLSSWLIRLALEHGCDPLTLTGSIWPGDRVWTRDIDRGLTEEKRSALSLFSGIEINLIEQASLIEEAKAITPCSQLPQGMWPWILGLGIRNRRYRGGVQYCPECFKQDKKVFLRKKWRLACSIGCLEHNARLLDHCPYCFQPIEPHRLEASETSTISICASCKFDLSSSMTEPIIGEAKQFQILAFKTIEKGFIEMAEKKVFTSKWFDLCRFLIVIIRRSINSPNSSVTKALLNSGIDVRTAELESCGLQLELMPCIYRERLLAVLYELLSNIEDFIKNLKVYGIKANSLVEKGCLYPEAAKFIFENLEMKPRLVVKRKKQNKIQGRTKKRVLKSWERLKRKYRLK